MSLSLNILILEDNPDDAELAIIHLQQAGYKCRYKRVETRSAFLNALQNTSYDLILADYNLPTFDGLTALKLFLVLAPDIPFILVSGQVGEEIAIESLKAGATDYVLKDRLSRLESVVTRALREKMEHRQRKKAEQALRHLTQTLEQRVTDRTRELTALYNITAVAGQALDMQTILDRSLAAVLEAMRTHTGMIHLLDPRTQTITLAAQQNISPNLAFQIFHLPATVGWGHKIINHTEPFIIAPPLETPFLPYVFQLAGFETFAAIPMRSRGEVIGSLSVMSHTAQKFNVEDVALLASIGDQVATVIQNAQLHQQAQHAAIMKERSRLARDLHDSVTQLLYSLTLLTSSGSRAIKAGREIPHLQTYLSDLCDISQQALKEMRLLVHQLRPALLEQDGLIGAIQHRLEAVERRSGVDAHFILKGHVEDIPASAEEHLYKIIQEGLNNALKYAAASTILVQIETSHQTIRLRIEDDGQGFDPANLKDQGGMGLKNIKNRVEKLNGTLKVHTAPEKGARLFVEFTL